MWPALRVELAYVRPWLLGGLGIAAGVGVLLTVIFAAVGEDGPPPHAAAGLRGMFMVLAPMIVGFILQGIRAEERRARLFLAAPLTPRQLAGVSVLLPVILSAVGVLAAVLMFAVEYLVTGRFVSESLRIAGYVGGLMFTALMAGLLIQEAAVARQQGRSRAAAAGWASLAPVVLLWAALNMASVFFQGPLTWPILYLGNLLGSLTAMVAGVVLYAGRNDFTR